VLWAAWLIGPAGLFFVVVVAISGVLFVVGGRMVYSSHKKRSSRQEW
jgi:hypothetical protein